MASGFNMKTQPVVSTGAALNSTDILFGAAGQSAAEPFVATLGAIIEKAKADLFIGVPTILTPEKFLAVGNGVVDDTASIISWLAALKAVAAAVGRVVGQFSGVYAISGSCQLSAWTGEILFEQTAPGAGFKLTGSNPRYDGIFISGAGPTGATTTITANAVLGDISITVASAAALAVGDSFELASTSTDGNARLMWNRVSDKVGNVLTLETPLAFDIASAQPSRVQKTVLQKGLTIRGMSITSSATGKVQGLSCYNVENPSITGITLRDINSIESVGLAIYGAYGGIISDVYDVGSGYATGSSSAAIFISGTGVSVNNIRSYSASGFGLDLVNCFKCSLSGLDVQRSKGRAIKMATSCANSFIAVSASSLATFVGLAVTGGSCDNVFTNIRTEGSLTASATGIWLNGTGNKNNRFTQVSSKGNTFDIFVGNLDTGNMFDMVNNDIGTVETGSSGAIIRTARRTLVRAKPTSAQVIASGASFVKGLFNTVLDDANGEYDTVTNPSRVTIKRPGYYLLKLHVTWDTVPTAALVELVFNINGAGYVGPSVRRRDTSNNFSCLHTATVFLKKGDYVETILGQNSGSNRSTSANETETIFEVVGL